MPTINALITTAALRLSQAGVSEARLTATILLSELSGYDRTYLFTHANDEAPHAILTPYHSAIERRAQGEPLQYITGHQEFYGRDFIVTPNVLIPRSETEIIIDTTLNLSRINGYTHTHILDVGTGSGCIAVTLAAELQQASVVAIDISVAAVHIAQRNAIKYGVWERIKWIVGDLCTAISDRYKFDFCCANLPYIAMEDAASLMPEVVEHEPATALFAADQGLSAIKSLFSQTIPLVRDGGYLLCEIGYGQEASALASVDRHYWQAQPTIKDLQGIPRTLLLQRTSAIA
jgi:release factor glutamine methyltransferase